MLHPHSLANAKYFSLSTGGPLSERSVSGIPSLENKLKHTRNFRNCFVFVHCTKFNESSVIINYDQVVD